MCPFVVSASSPRAHSARSVNQRCIFIGWLARSSLASLYNSHLPQTRLLRNRRPSSCREPYHAESTCKLERISRCSYFHVRGNVIFSALHDKKKSKLHCYRTCCEHCHNSRVIEPRALFFISLSKPFLRYVRHRCALSNFY